MTAANQTLARLERLLVVVPWLLEHPGADVAAVSARLGVARDELLADLDLLGYCGLPGYGGGDLIEVSIVGDHVTLRMADFFRRPLRLSLREAVTLLLAARALAGVEGLAESAVLARAAARLESALGAGADGPRLAISLGGPGEEHLAPLRTAVAANRVVRLTYRSETRAATTVREVEPWSLTAAGGGWYLQGWCRTAGGPRDFRLDRIRELAVTGETADPPPAPPPPPTYRPEPHHERVVLECTPAAAWLAEWAMAESDVPARGRRRRITLAVDHLDWAARLVLRMGDDVRVVSPDALAARVRALAAEALDRYGDAADGSPRGA